MSSKLISVKLPVDFGVSSSTVASATPTTSGAAKTTASATKPKEGSSNAKK